MIEKRLTVFERTSLGRKCVSMLKTLEEMQAVQLKWRPLRTAQMVCIIYMNPLIDRRSYQISRQTYGKSPKNHDQTTLGAYDNLF